MKLLVGAGVAALAWSTLATASLAAERPEPIFKTGTESSQQDLTLPPQKIVNAVIRSMDKEDVRKLDQCVEDEQLRPRAYQQLLRSSVFRPTPGHALYFVRDPMLTVRPSTSPIIFNISW